MSDKKNVLLIVNPCAGKTRTRASAEDIIKEFPEDEYEFSVHNTTCHGDATRIVNEHHDDKDIVICCGGDGTLNETINGVMDMAERIPVGYIPMGTTNDLANTLSIPLRVGEAVKLIQSGQTNSYDIGLFNNRYFSYVASFGAFSSAAYKTSQKMKNMFGHSAYFWKGFMDWGSLKSMNVKVEYDDGAFEGEVMLGAITNSTSMGGIFQFDREKIKLNDGYFEVLLVKKINLVKIAPLYFKVQKGDYSDDCFVFIKTRQVKFTFDNAVEWCLDGEFGGEHKVVNANVLSKAVRIFSGENDLFEKDPELPEEPEVPRTEEKTGRFKFRRKNERAQEEKTEEAQEEAVTE